MSGITATALEIIQGCIIFGCPRGSYFILDFNQVESLANNYDPKDLATSKTKDKTVYPDTYTEADIDAMGEKAFTQAVGDKKLPYKVSKKGEVQGVEFNSTVKGPDGTDIEVEGYVIPKPDGTPDYIKTHYPKFDSNSKGIVKEK